MKLTQLIDTLHDTTHLDKDNTFVLQHSETLYTYPLLINTIRLSKKQRDTIELTSNPGSTATLTIQEFINACCENLLRYRRPDYDVVFIDDHNNIRTINNVVTENNTVTLLYV